MNTDMDISVAYSDAGHLTVCGSTFRDINCVESDSTTRIVYLSE